MALAGVLDWLLSKSAIAVLTVVVLLFFVARSYEQPVHELEPPAIRSRVPFIGHMIRTLNEQSFFLKNLV